jgi:hypothetical protein
MEARQGNKDSDGELRKHVGELIKTELLRILKESAILLLLVEWHQWFLIMVASQLSSG